MVVLKLKKYIIHSFIILIVVLLSLNFIYAEDLNETDSLKINDESIPVDLNIGENEQNATKED